MMVWAGGSSPFFSGMDTSQFLCDDYIIPPIHPYQEPSSVILPFCLQIFILPQLSVSP